MSASYAQFGVDAEDEGIGQVVMAYNLSTHYLWRPIIVVSLYVYLLTDLLRNRNKPVSWRKLCAV